MTKYSLLTGATGLVGRYLIRDLLMQGNRLALVLRPSKNQNVFERVEAIQQMWEKQLGRSLPRPVCFEGDVGKEDLGLDVTSQKWIAEHCDNIIHNAAVLTFHGSDSEAEPWKTNVQGTRNVIQLCKDANLRKMHYVSTAYVCGTRTGIIKEDELDFGQNFRNDYEHSKLQAEKIIRKEDFFDSLTVYRPAVIAGDARSGYTNTYHGLYMYLKLISVLVRNVEPGPDGVRYTPIQLGMTGDELRNIVPVDWVSAVISRLINTPAAHGNTYHLAPTNPITPRHIVEAGYKYFNSRGVEFIGPEYHEKDQRVSNVDKDLHENMTMYESYEITDPTFDTTNLQKFTADLPCPVIDEAMLHRFWKFGEQDRWGKRREPKPEIPFWASDHLAGLADFNSTPDLNYLQPSNSRQRLVGLEITGPGGGQWTIAISNHQTASVEIGLPSDDAVILQLSITVFRDIVENADADLAAKQIRLKRNGSEINSKLADSVIKELLSYLSTPARTLRAKSPLPTNRISAKSSPATED